MMTDDELKIHFRSKARLKLCPNGYSAIGDEITTISDPTPTQEEIDAEIKVLQAEYDAQEYARKRAEAYPSVGDQLDMIYKDMKNSTTTHAEAVEAIKTKFPKE